MAAWAYILKCADDSYYVGCTTHLLQRFGQHQAGDHDGYTVVERQLKGWSRLKKEAVIPGDYGALHVLAKKGFKPSSSS
ncbi:MAG: GIY-YIG nuclease family protein [Caulobacteraceae bacterium]|nr:GIY-YIG nuclease family protein [Caulobacteraceae bacterium]